MHGSDLVKKIDIVLKEKNLKRQALADYCGINAYTITDWIRRGNLPTFDVGLKISQFLGVSVEWLLDENYENSWLQYDDKVTTNDLWMSPSGIVRRLEIIIRQRFSTEIKRDKYIVDELFFDCITDILSYDQILAAYKNHYEPTIIQLYEISKKLHLSLEWLITGKETNNIAIEDRYLLGIAKQFPNFLRYYNCLPKSDQKQIQELVVHLFHSRHKIRDSLIDKNVDLKDIPELLQ